MSDSVNLISIRLQCDGCNSPMFVLESMFSGYPLGLIACDSCGHQHRVKDFILTKGSSTQLDSEVHSESYNYSGVDYSISVIKEGRFFFGKWHCNSCGDDGGSSKECPSIKDAVDYAKLNVGPHQTMKHG